jgi:WD40 repeat protein
MAGADTTKRGGGSLPARPERPDVFISYSRRDRDFVEQSLAPALVARGKDVWVDLEDIEPAADWRERIGSGIAEASAFLFLLTPDSARSDVCAEELTQAVAANKRLVPVLRRTVDHTVVHETLARHNWIWLRDEDDFDSGMERVVDALETDLEWRDAHARLAVRAQEWSRAGQDRSFLLRGSDLVAAETWLADQHHHHEAPTDAHVAYILAGRRGATRRQRAMLASVLLALAVTAVLAVLALVAQRRAETNERRAVANERTARSRELAATALLTARSDPALAVATASEANRVARTDQALTALRQSLAAWPARGVYAHEGALRGAAYSPDGRLVVTTDGESLRVWSASSRRLLAEHPDDDSLSPATRFSPDSRSLLTASENAVTAWDARSGARTRTVDAGGDVTSARFDRSGRRLVVAAGDRVSIRRWPGGARVASVRVPGWSLDRAELSPDGRYLLAAGADYLRDETAYAAMLWRLPDRRPVLTVRHREPVTAATFSPRGDRLVTASDDDTAQLWRLDPLRRTRVIRHRSDVTSASFRRDGRALLTSGLDARAQVTATATGRRLAVLEGGGVHLASTFSPDGRSVAATNDLGAFFVWDVASRRRTMSAVGHRRRVPSVAFSPDGAALLTGGEDGRAREWRSGPGARPRVLRAGTERASSVELSPDGRLAVTSSDDRRARVWDVRSGRIVRVLGSHGVAVQAAAFASRGRSVITVGRDRTAVVWDLATGRARHRLEERWPLRSVWGGEHHDRVLLAGADGSAAVWDAALGRRIAPIDGPDRMIDFARFSPDGRRLVTSATAEPTRVWEVATGRQLHALGGESNPAYGAALSRDGRFVVNAAGPSGLRVYSAESGKPADGLRGSATADASPAFSAGGTALASVNQVDEVIRVYDWVSRSEVREIPGIYDLAALDRSGRYVAAAAGRRVGVWDVRTAEQILRYTAPRTVVVLEMSADGTSVLTADRSGRAQLVACDLCRSRGDLLDLADARGARPLTPAERTRLGG